jgi:hypothetical protein
VLGTSQQFPVSGDQLTGYLIEHCDEARGEGAEEFFSVTVRKLLDRMGQIGMLDVQPNGFRLTENGCWSMLRTIERIHGAIDPGTLLAANSGAVSSLGLSFNASLRGAELLLARDAGKWDFWEFLAKVLGKARTLVLVDSELGLCGGYAAVPWATSDEWVSDPSGASFVFTIKPKVDRFALVSKALAIHSPIRADDSEGFEFGGGCLQIWNDGLLVREKSTYAVPEGWALGDDEDEEYPKFTRFEIWQLTA